MKKNGVNSHFRSGSSGNLLKKMKLLITFFFAGLLGVSASTYSQQTKLSLKFDEVTVKEAFKQIEKNSEFVFFYNEDYLDVYRKVSINVNDEKVESILNELLNGTHNTFKIYDRQIVILPSAMNELPLINKSGTQTEQKKSITGKVTDSSGVPLPAVSVIVKGTTIGTSTDADGIYSISKIPENSILQFSFLGMKVKEIVVGNKTTIDVIMEEVTIGLEEVVAVGYGTTKKSDFTGASAGVDAKVISESPIVTVENALQGRLAGVNILNSSAEPGGGISVQIRGITSISGGNQPLYVIDGIPMYNDNANSAKEFETNVATNSLATINPSDIQSVEVLKDASSTAIYGSRGANGVILITTKRGSSSKLKIQLSSYVMFVPAPKPIPLANAKEYATFFNTSLENSGNAPQFIGQYFKSTNKLDSIYLPSPQELGEGTNWQKEIFRNAVTTNHQVSLSGGSEDFKFLISGNYLKDQGVVKFSEYQRGSLRVNLDARASKKLNIKLDINMTADANDRAENSNAIGVGEISRNGVILKSFMASPILSNTNTTIRQRNNFLNNSQFYLTLLNPLSDLENTINQRKSDFTIANMTLDYKFSKSLNLTVRGGLNGTHSSNNIYWNGNTQLGYLRGQKTFQSSNTRVSYLNEDFLTFNKRIKKLDINLVGGVSWQKNVLKTCVLGGEGLAIPSDNGLYLLPLYASRDVPSTNRIDDVLLSGYGRFSLSYNKRYMLNVTARGDGSSRFAVNKKWAFFPSLGAAWNFSEESFLKNKSILSTGKIRGSYGTSGNQAIAGYQSLPSLSPVYLGFIDGVITGLIPGNPGNPELTWETTKQINAGLDLGVKKDKFTLTFDLYKKVTENLLQSKSVPAASGYTAFLSNFGSIENRGFEFQLKASVLRKKTFTWSTNFNISANRNKVLDLGPDVQYYNLSSGSSGVNDYTHRLTVGQPFGTFWGYKTDGLLTADDITNKYPKLTSALTEGSIKIVDFNNDGKITDLDRCNIGNAFPKYTLGFGNGLTYANFSLDIFINASLGSQIMNQNLVWSEYGATTGIPNKKYINDYWTPTNKDAKYPRPSMNNPNFQTTDQLIEDGSYVRIKNISLRYNFPKLPRGISKLQVYVTSTNLHTFTKYSGYDPEISAFGQNNLLAGVDLGCYPRSKSWTIGLDINF